MLKDWAVKSVFYFIFFPSEKKLSCFAAILSNKIANVISTISKHEYNYRGDDKNKVKKIGTQLYVLKKKHKVAIGTTKSSLCSDTEKWLPTAVMILKKITDDGRL